MAQTKRKRQTKKRQTTKKTTHHHQHYFWQRHKWHVLGGVLIVFNLLGLLKLGVLGLWWNNILAIISGDFAWLSELILLALGLYLCLDRPSFPRRAHVLGGSALIYLALLLADSAWFFRNDTFNYHFGTSWQTLINNGSGTPISTAAGGGLLGTFMYGWTHFLVSQFGTYLLVGLLLISGLFLLANITFNQAKQWVIMRYQQIKHWYQQWHQRKLTPPDELTTVATPLPDEVTSASPTSTATSLASTAPVVPTSSADLPTPELKENILPHRSHAEELDAANLVTTPTHSATVPHNNQHYQLPPLSLLTKITNADRSNERQVIAANKQKLKATFDSFKVDVSVKNAVMGPAVTRYEIQPAIGVKVSKIINLTDDLALALAAKDLRIEAPIPGKSLIGIEVPNQNVATVSFRAVMAPQYFHADKPLEVPLGQDIEGNVITCDLSAMPHLLIAGATGSGKSVMINDMITSLLMRNRPEAVKLMLIDPKMVELSAYNDVPHLLTPVVTDSRKAANALNKAVKEMERRYNLFAQTGVHKMQEYNQKVAQDPSLGEPLPYIVIVVDELADLMMVAGNEVESAIIRLAQMARAAGMHMIIATQRPSVDVITGLIKANIPSRIAFAVSSSIDARTILDTSGAEKLLGRGDMLYKPMNASKPMRVQGAYIATQDVLNVVDFIKQEQTAVYDDTMLPTAPDDDHDTQQSEDALYPEAVAFVAQKKAASVSMLQRRFRIGYNRAARLVDEMEANGIVGPMMGSKPRQVFLDKINNLNNQEGKQHD